MSSEFWTPQKGAITFFSNSDTNTRSEVSTARGVECASVQRRQGSWVLNNKCLPARQGDKLYDT